LLQLGAILEDKGQRQQTESKDYGLPTDDNSGNYEDDTHDLEAFDVLGKEGGTMSNRGSENRTEDEEDDGTDGGIGKTSEKYDDGRDLNAYESREGYEVAEHGAGLESGKSRVQPHCTEEAEDQVLWYYRNYNGQAQSRDRGHKTDDGEDNANNIEHLAKPYQSV